MKEKVYEIELTEEELEILSAILNWENSGQVITYCIRHSKTPLTKFLDKYYNLEKRIKDIVNTNKHQNV